MKKSVVAVVVTVIALAGCSSNDSGSNDPQPTATSTAQTTPQATVAAFYEAVAKGDLGAACKLTSPELDWPTLTKDVYPTCEAALFTSYTVNGRADFSGVAVDESKVKITGDTATVPEAAVTFNGKPSADEDNPLVFIDGRWYLDVEPV